ncbi:Mitochondrial metalloendopeptidase OMA1 [Cytospora mali]|uniref:Mitochondrial metalloendopeptidase OMA1 n=1 Tax=Cytospora mali TaxID=578113 RepID=A0A194WCL9_CYTMA|nr:Mitochondrial metalloendopeptidase OMA1 [Valsa mali]
MRLPPTIIPPYSPSIAPARPATSGLLLSSLPRRRPFSLSSPRRRSQDPRQRPEIDYDPSLGDPWYHHRLRNAKPLFKGNAKTILRSPRTHTVVAVSVALAVGFYFWNLEVVPVSGRKRFNCYSENSVKELSVMQYKRLIYDMEQQGARFLGDWDPRTIMVKRVMARLIPVSGVPEGEEWEVRVIDDRRTANAFVLPGGKVFVYSGILGLARTESQLAAVLGHEIAHNLAKHYGERLSQSVGETAFLGSLLMLLAATPLTFIVGWMFGGNLLDLLFSRPMGRMQESEADYIGLMMMAEACYDPRDAVAFWQRMERAHQQSDVDVPEWASTHPSNQHRIERINEWLPKAMEKREASDCHGTQGFAEMFRRAMARGDVMGGSM